MTKLNYRLPKIYDASGNLSKQWFVYYSFLNPETKKFQRFRIFQDINSGSTKAERMEKARLVQLAMAELLEDGFNPFEDQAHDNTFTIINCIDIFLEAVKDRIRPKSYNRYFYEFRLMKQWFIDQGLQNLHISQVKKNHIFNHLEFARQHGDWTSGKTYNTHKSNISRLFNFFINNYDEVLDKNPVETIESKPVITRGNQPYNENEFKAIQKVILENDPYLWRICQFVYYAAVRNEQEGLNLKVKHIDWGAGKLVLPPEITKAKSTQFIPIYPEFKKILLEMGLMNVEPNYFIFGRDDRPGPLRVGKDNFYDRFKKMRSLAGLSKHHGIYSFKHTRACHMVDDGSSLYEIQTLFRHGNLQATMEYLKSVGRIIGERKLSSARDI
ncbi:tyrosine-type recombinase/integrase [Pleomorphovibrio marinus]|uniref:tyrosine-type recombinase/integrase n=1 Tax=Pleomorphovibrio marinus TaxID=2164132 RepID=UPI000E0B5C09|nr:tyrosine-type recombinase/integrase [Pleomorphovibrio marinus]